MTGQFGWRCDKDIIKEATMEKVSVEKVGGIGNESKTRSKYLRRPTMKLNLSTESLARASAQHRWITIGAWLTVLVAAVVLTGALLGDTLTTEDGPTNNPESIRANSLLGERLGESNDTINEMVIVQSTKLTVDDPAYQSYSKVREPAEEVGQVPVAHPGVSLSPQTAAEHSLSKVAIPTILASE